MAKMPAEGTLLLHGVTPTRWYVWTCFARITRDCSLADFYYFCSLFFLLWNSGPLGFLFLDIFLKCTLYTNNFPFINLFMIWFYEVSNLPPRDNTPSPQSVTTRSLCRQELHYHASLYKLAMSTDNLDFILST